MFSGSKVLVELFVEYLNNLDISAILKEKFNNISHYDHSDLFVLTFTYRKFGKKLDFSLQNIKHYENAYWADRRCVINSSNGTIIFPINIDTEISTLIDAFICETIFFPNNDEIEINDEFLRDRIVKLLNNGFKHTIDLFMPNYKLWLRKNGVNLEN